MGAWSYVAPRFATALRELSPEDQRQDGNASRAFAGEDSFKGSFKDSFEGSFKDSCKGSFKGFIGYKGPCAPKVYTLALKYSPYIGTLRPKNTLFGYMEPSL